MALVTEEAGERIGAWCEESKKYDGTAEPKLECPPYLLPPS